MELSKEEQEAIERCKELIDDIFKCDDEDEIIADAYIGGILQILLNLISKLQKENEKQSKVIDEMADKLSEYTCWNKDNLDMNKLASIEEIRQYFYRKVEEDD